MQVSLFFFMLIFSIQLYADVSLKNKPVVSQYFNKDKCFNYNENYICIPSTSPTNNLQKLMNKNSTYLFDKKINFSEEDVFKYLHFKWKKSEYRAYNNSRYDEGGKEILKGYQNKYKPIYDKELSVKFQAFVMSSLETKIDDSNIYEEYIETIINLIKSDSFIIKIYDYNNIYIYINPTTYNNSKDIFNEFLTLLDKQRFNAYPHIEKKIHKFSKLLKLKNINNEITVELNNLLSTIINDIIALKIGKSNYLFKQIYTVVLDLILLEDKNEFLNKIGLSMNASDRIKKEYQFVTDFYKKYPVKVFITQTNNMHPPFVDGLHGYLYIHKSDYIKYKTLNLMDYLMMHESKHVSIHIVSPLKRSEENIKRLNIEKMMTLFKDPGSIIFKIIKLYDYNKEFYQATQSSIIQEFKQEEQKNKDKSNYYRKEILKNIKTINDYLPPYEELGIDLANLEVLSFDEKKNYLKMLEVSLPKYNGRLSVCKLDIELQKIKQQFHLNSFDFVKLVDFVFKNSQKNNQLNLKYTEIEKLDNLDILYKEMGSTVSFAIKLYGKENLIKKLKNLKKYLLLKKSLEDRTTKYINLSISKGEL